MRRGRPSGIQGRHSLAGWAAAWVFTVLLTSHAATVQFSVIGDYGVDNASELAVANLVRTNLQPDFIVTTGDNTYFDPADAEDFDRAVGKYYSTYIGNYAGAYGSGASSNRFFPSLGNHDWSSASGYAVYTNYFTLPGNERYYDIRRGPVHLFVINSDANEPHGTAANSQQPLWLSNVLRQSTAPWKVIAMHHAPFSSTDAAERMRWPYEAWGAALVLSGHAHHYERLDQSIPYIVCGASGAPLHGFSGAAAGSLVRYSAGHGAMRIIATETNLIGQFWTIEDGGRLVDQFTLTRTPRLRVSTSSGSVRVSWPTNDGSGFALQSTDTVPSTAWSQVTNTPTDAAGMRTVTIPSAGSGRKFFRLQR